MDSCYLLHVKYIVFLCVFDSANLGLKRTRASRKHFTLTKSRYVSYLKDVLNKMYMPKRVLPLRFASHSCEYTSINLSLSCALKCCSVATPWISHTNPYPRWNNVFKWWNFLIHKFSLPYCVRPKSGAYWSQTMILKKFTHMHVNDFWMFHFERLTILYTVNWEDFLS